jgi:hypothetical protein
VPLRLCGSCFSLLPFAICLALSPSVPLRLCGSAIVNVVIRLVAAEEAVCFYLWNLWILL